MNSSKQIKWGALLSYFSIAFNIVSGLLYTPWMVETIGKSQYGLYTLANSLITMFLVDFGLSSATSRYLSKYNAEGNQEAAERFLGAVYKLYMAIDGVIFSVLLVMFFFLEEIYVNLTPTELAQFKVVYVISALFSVINFPFVTFNGILSAYEKFIPLKVIDLLYRVLNIGLTVVALLMGKGLYALVVVHACVGLLMLAIKFVVVRKSVPLKVKFGSAEKGLYKEIFSFSIWVTISIVTFQLIMNISPSILGVVANAGAIAVFGVVSTVYGYTYTITQAISGMFMPKVSQILIQPNAEEQLNSLLLTVGKFQQSINGLIVAGFAVVGKLFVNLWMGPDYLEAYWGAVLIIASSMFYSSLQIAHTTAIAMNKVKMIAFLDVIIGVLNVALSFPLSKKYGVLGACLAICVSYIVRVVICNFLYNRYLPVDIPAFVKKCYLRMSVPIVLTVLAGIGINRWIADGGWLVFFLKAGITAALYFVLVILLGYSSEERKAILRYIKR